MNYIILETLKKKVERFPFTFTLIQIYSFSIDWFTPLNAIHTYIFVNDY